MLNYSKDRAYWLAIMVFTCDRKELQIRANSLYLLWMKIFFALLRSECVKMRSEMWISYERETICLFDKLRG